MQKRRTWKARAVVKASLLVFLIIAVLAPLICLLFSIGSVDVGSIVGSRQFLESLKNSVLVTLTATAVSLVLALVLAWCIARSGLGKKGALSQLLSLPMLIPSISHGMGLIVLFGANGVLTNLLGLNTSIYGFWGIVIGSVMYSFPVAFLMLLDVFQYEDYTVYESAQVLGIPKIRQFLSITLPYLRKPMISVMFATFTLIFTDYGVPLMVGGKFMTLPVYMYNEVIGLMNFGKGAVVGLFLLMPAVVAFLFDLFNKDSGNASFTVKSFEIKKSRKRDCVCRVLVGVAIVLVLLPIVSFALLTFVEKYPIDMSLSLHNITQAMDMGTGKYLVNSLIIAVLTATAGTAIAYLNAYFAARSKGILARSLHLGSIATLAVPGIVLGLSYVMFFKGSFLYGTLAILILVNTIHFFASPYLMAYNAMHKLNPNLEAVAKTIGIPSWRLIKDVFIPQTRDTMLEMFSYFFVNSMITISAVSFLSTVKNMPVSMMITQFEGMMLLECSAYVSLLILVVNLLMKGVIHGLKRHGAARRDGEEENGFEPKTI